MPDKLARRLKLQTDSTIFFVSAGLMVAFLILLLLFPDWIRSTFATSKTWVVTNLGWYFILGVTVWLLFLIYLAISKYGNIRLGNDDDRPAYGNVPWFTMLFAGGIGTVLMFWGVAEPISHFAEPPRAAEAFSPGAAKDAMSIAIYHFGLHTWTLFTLPGLAIGYFVYRRKLPLRMSSMFYPFLKDRIYGPIGKAIDIFAILGTLFGLAVSLGLGTNQINAGLTDLFGVPNAVLPKVIIIALLTALAVISVVVGLDKGVKRLSNINIGMAVGLMVFVFLAGSTVFLSRELVETVGTYLQDLVPLSLWNDSMAEYTGGAYGDGWGWQIGWTVFYWTWTVTWGPFMGIFLARISKGRTIRQFIGGVLVAPSVFTLIWFSVFGWTAMQSDGIGKTLGNGEPITQDSHPVSSAVVGYENAAGEQVDGDAATAMFTFFDQLLANDGLVMALSAMVVLLAAIFFATSSDSASLVIDMLCTGSDRAGPTRQRVFWGVSEGALAAALIVLAGNNGLLALQEVITVVGLPIFTLMFIALVALWKGLQSEKYATIRVPIAAEATDKSAPVETPPVEAARE